MVKHIVLWNIQEGPEKAEVLQTLKAKLEALTKEIGFLRKIEVGINFNDSDSSHDVSLYTEFDSKEDLDAYVVHPAHVEVGKYVRSVVKDRVVVDYEV
ncbi:Dabb family protein [Anaerotalea alkaliphila]|uniref:Dabb family protein n=1 Tax=Anaerotalea alkaliphila TaxID=2662126 RepID=A0A7X5HW21_9FIRM|nr:Dabb family protein [Anaerotalea alkaliphila]NDL67718.1 Dabb family protein [Anaerotalea alkaliphila]